MKIWKIESEKQFYDIIIKYDKDKLKLLLDNKENYYGNPIDVPKKNGYRQIYCINKRCDLYRIQKRMVDNFLKNIKVSDRTCGFVKGSSYYDFMEPHKDFYKRNQYLRLDLKNFFGSISKKMVTDCLLYYVDEKIVNRDELIKMIFEILTYNNILIQGAITSPIISNIVFRELDIRIQKYCRKYDIIYTRYADDLLFSGYNSILLILQGFRPCCFLLSPVHSASRDCRDRTTSCLGNQTGKSGLAKIRFPETDDILHQPKPPPVLLETQSGALVQDVLDFDR